jgi:hypothetical protein
MSKRIQISAKDMAFLKAFRDNPLPPNEKLLEAWNKLQDIPPSFFEINDTTPSILTEDNPSEIKGIQTS